MLPNDEPGLRTLVTQRPTNSGEISEEIDLALSKLLQTEISSMVDLESSKRELLEGSGSSAISQIFREIDKDSSGFINFQNLFDFFKKNGIYPYEEELIAIIRKLDKDDDGRLVLEELEEGLGPIPQSHGYSKESYSPYYNRGAAKFDNEERGLKAAPKEYSSKSYTKETQNQYSYKNETFNPNNNYKGTNLKKSYNYENKYPAPKNVYDEALTEKQHSKQNYSKFNDDIEENKPARNYNYTYSQKETVQTSSSYKKKPLYNNPTAEFNQEKPDETKDYLNKYLQKDYKKPNSQTNSNSKYDYYNENVTKSPPRTFYYPHEPIRKAFSPMKDKILKSSRFDQPQEAYSQRPKNYQVNSNPARTRTPIGRSETWRIEEKLKKIDDNYAKNSKYSYAPNNKNEDITKSAPKQVLSRDYTPDPTSKRSLYQTMNMTPDKLFETNYMQSSQYRKDRDIVDKIMGPSENGSSQRPVHQHSNSQYSYSNTYKSKTPQKPYQQASGSNSDLRDLGGYLTSLTNYEGELERMKQDLALRPDFNLVDLFVFFDADQKGHCTLQEFTTTLQEKIDLFVQEKEALLFIKRFDKGESGVIKFADFGSAFTSILSEYLELLNQRKPINTDLQFSFREVFYLKINY